MRSSTGGWLANSPSQAGRSVMPKLRSVCGSAPGSRPPSRARAAIIGPGVRVRKLDGADTWKFLDE